MVTPQANNYTSARNEPPRVLTLQYIKFSLKYLGKRNENFGVLAARLYVSSHHGMDHLLTVKNSLRNEQSSDVNELMMFKISSVLSCQYHLTWF